MDVQRLTTLARETLSVAIRQTSAAGNPTVEPIHLLSALLAQPEGTTIGLLEAAGGDLDAVRRKTAEQLSRLPKASGGSVQAPSASRCFQPPESRPAIWSSRPFSPRCSIIARAASTGFGKP